MQFMGENPFSHGAALISIAKYKLYQFYNDINSLNIAGHFFLNKRGVMNPLPSAMYRRLI